MPAPLLAGPALQLWGVGKGFAPALTPWRSGRRSEALRGVSISVARGECYGLAGPNGAGKTTLIRLLLGLLEPDQGEVRLLGLRPNDPEVRRRVGFVPESADLPPAASPRALVRRFAWLRGLDLRSAVPQGLAQLERLGVGELVDRPCGRLSKGERQRTLFALALLGEPELLVLDEPTDGLDPLGRALVRRVLGEERARGRTVFLNSHLLSETERICTRVGILHRGRLVREELIEQRGRGALERGTSAIVLAAPIARELLEAAGARLAPPLQGQVTEAEGETVLVEHAGLLELNLALDKLRAGGALLVEVRPVRADLEASFALAVGGAQAEDGATAEDGAAEDGAAEDGAAEDGAAEDRAAVADGGNAEGAAKDPRGDAPSPGAAPAPRPARALFASLRVAREIGLDLASRKLGWMALALALLALGLGLWGLRNDVVLGAAAVVRDLTGKVPDSVEARTVATIVGRESGLIVYWILLTSTLLFSTLFAPPLLDPRRTVLLLAQPISRVDLATGIFLAVCGLTAATFSFLVALFFCGVRALGIGLPASFLLVPLPLLLSFAALYALVLGATYLVRSGLFAALVGLASLIGFVALGNTDAARPGAPLGLEAALYGLSPKVVALSEQAGHLGEGHAVSAFPFFSTAAYLVAVLTLVAVGARRSER